MEERGRMVWKGNTVTDNGKAKRNWHLVIHWHMHICCKLSYFLSTDERTFTSTLAQYLDETGDDNVCTFDACANTPTPAGLSHFMKPHSKRWAWSVLEDQTFFHLVFAGLCCICDSGRTTPC